MTTLALPIVADLSGLRRRWTRAVAIGELIGFLPPAIVGATLAAIGVPDAVLILGLTVAGLCEGAAIGVMQASVLGRYAPGIDRRAGSSRPRPPRASRGQSA